MEKQLLSSLATLPELSDTIHSKTDWKSVSRVEVSRVRCTEFFCLWTPWKIYKSANHTLEIVNNAIKGIAHVWGGSDGH